MRQRRAKNLDARMERQSGLLISDAAGRRGRWAELFESAGEGLFSEIGCGKGQFARRSAELRPERNFIAFEGNSSVIINAAERYEAGLGAKTAEAADGAGIKRRNLVFVRAFVREPEEIFAKEELSGIYINFTDPWPKERHAKRRLTHGKKLLAFSETLKRGAFLDFRTDNEILFEFTLEGLSASELRAAYDIELFSRDLHSETGEAFSEARAVTTEYEDKFSAKGKNINYLRLRRR